jgi:hypothetical protein
MNGAFLVGFALATALQGDAVDVGPDILVSLAGVDAPIVEPHLSINPNNAKQLLAAAMVAQGGGTYGVIAIASNDGGGTWQLQRFESTQAGDPWTAFLPDGTALVAFLDGPDAALRLFRSSNGGRSWSETPTTVADNQDHPTLLSDPRGALYTVSAGITRAAQGRNRNAIIVTRSTDGGRTFPESTRVVASNLSYEPHNPALLADGTLVIPFADHRRPGSGRRLEVTRDWLVVSTDGGRTFSEPRLISESCDGRGGWSSLAAFRTRIYHLCPRRDQNGIEVRHSDTLGDTWSEPLRIDRPGDVTAHTRTPAIAVNAQGIVGVAWYDARRDRGTIKGNLRCQEVFFAASVDGGLTFLPERRVSTAPTCPATPRNVETALRFPGGGDYMGLAAAPDGSFRLLWADSRTEIYRLYTTTLTVRGVVGF